MTIFFFSTRESQAGGSGSITYAQWHGPSEASLHRNWAMSTRGSSDLVSMARSKSSSSKALDLNMGWRVPQLQCSLPSPACSFRSTLSPSSCLIFREDDHTLLCSSFLASCYPTSCAGWVLRTQLFLLLHGTWLIIGTIIFAKIKRGDCGSPIFSTQLLHESRPFQSFGRSGLVQLF